MLTRVGMARDAKIAFYDIGGNNGLVQPDIYLTAELLYNAGAKIILFSSGRGFSKYYFLNFLNFLFFC